MPARVLEESASTIDTLASDNSINQFTDTTFDPVTFINDSLPGRALPSTFSSDQARSKDSSLLEVTAKTQTFLTKVNAQNIRSASTLSQLTDEILRSGGRLAYEVEVLRGDANALHESLTDNLREDIQRFTLASAGGSQNDNAGQEQPDGIANSQDPEFIGQLRTLGQVKARLDEVIHVFGEAMKWPLPPSEFSLTSSLISVSAPEPGSENASREEKGKEFAKKARAEIIELLNNAASNTDTEAAGRKVEALRVLSTVWKGTAEERPRTKFVDSLSKLVEDRRRQIEARSESQPAKSTDGAAARSSSAQGRPAPGLARDRPVQETRGSGGGLFRNLQRLRDEIYLD
jgi:hypothetical protein